MDTEPDIFFIIPYRNRLAHLEIFMNHMKVILGNMNYMILISHQCDTRPFNRGGLKNLGFIWIKKNYPNTYKDKTLVISDVDSVYYRGNILKWKTTHGKIKHFYGCNPNRVRALGGIFSITGGDYEKLNGFPNYWAWGYEDNALYQRAVQKKINIDYSQFHGMGSKYIIVFWHGPKRDVSESETWKVYDPERKNINGYGLSDIKNIKHELLKVSDKIFYLQNKNFDVPEKKPKIVEKKVPSKTFANSEREQNYKNLFRKF